MRRDMGNHGRIEGYAVEIKQGGGLVGCAFVMERNGNTIERHGKVKALRNSNAVYDVDRGQSEGHGMVKRLRTSHLLSKNGRAKDVPPRARCRDNNADRAPLYGNPNTVYALWLPKGVPRGGVCPVFHAESIA